MEESFFPLHFTLSKQNATLRSQEGDITTPQYRHLNKIIIFQKPSYNQWNKSRAGRGWLKA